MRPGRGPDRGLYGRNGSAVGEGFGKFVGQASDDLTDNGRKRNKLHQIAKKARAKGDHAKANRIRKFNLGRQKLRRQARQRKAEMERRINTAINQVVEKRGPAVVVTEKLDIRGKAQSKKISRRVSLWMRRVLKERVEFKASAECFRRKQTNPAYSSQLCPICGFVHAGNRRGDAFQCLKCGHIDDSDRVAAENHKARWNDPEITLFTPKARVKEILLARYYARLESRGNPTTVSGRTPGTPLLSVSKERVNRRAKRPTQSRQRGKSLGRDVFSTFEYISGNSTALL